MWRQVPTINNDSPSGTSVDGWRRDRIERSKSVQSQFGVLCPGEQARVKPRPVPPPQSPEVEGVEGPMSEVPQVVMRKGGMPAPRTRLQHLVDSKVLLKKKRRSNTTRLTSSGGGHRKCRSRELVST